MMANDDEKIESAGTGAEATKCRYRMMMIGLKLVLVLELPIYQSCVVRYM